MGRRRTLGYVQNEWTCPNCSTRNKGGVKTCENCVAPQPENIQFELPSEQKFVKDEAAIKAAQAGADIHCGFCGTRNPATAETCSNTAGIEEAKRARPVRRWPPVQPSRQMRQFGSENPSSSSVIVNHVTKHPPVRRAGKRCQAAEKRRTGY
jgi:hypothetical protein